MSARRPWSRATGAARAEVPRARMHTADLVSESLAGLLARPSRVALTVLGHGHRRRRARRHAGALEDGRQPDRRPVRRALGHRRGHQPLGPRGGGAGGTVLPWDAEARLRRLNGVAAAGTISDVDVRGALVRSVPLNDPLAAGAIQLPIKAASPGAFRAVRAELLTGRFFDAGHSRRADRVLVLGPGAARRVGITRVDQQPAVFIGDRLYTVVGLLSGVRRQSSLLAAAIMPEGTARREFGLQAPGLGPGRDPHRRRRASSPARPRSRSAPPTRTC